MDQEEDVTEPFRLQALRALVLNAESNRLRRKKKGDVGYLICNRSELAVAVGTDKKMINNILGPAKSTSKWDRVDRSTFVGRIRDVLHLAAVTQITVPVARAEVLRMLSEIPDEEFELFEAEVRRRPKVR